MLFGHDVKLQDAINYKTAVDHYNRIIKVACHTTVLTILKHLAQCPHAYMVPFFKCLRINLYVCSPQCSSEAQKLLNIAKELLHTEEAYVRRLDLLDQVTRSLAALLCVFGCLLVQISVSRLCQHS